MNKVTNEQFLSAYNDRNNRGIIESILNKFRGRLEDDDLEDLGMVALWKALGKYDESKGAKLTTYLYTILLRSCINAARRAKSQKDNSIKTEYVPEWENFSKEAIVDENVEYLREKVELLPSEDRKMIRMKFFENYTLEEIGEACGFSKEFARQRVDRAVGRLRKKCTTTIMESN